MPLSLSQAARGLSRRAMALALTLAPLTMISCGEGNPGTDPPADSFIFPSGLLIDPRVSTAATGTCESDADCGADEACGANQCRAKARWLLVTNANSDQRYNAGSMLPVDLDAYWEAAFDDPTAILSAGSSLDRETPCRRIAQRPQAVECTEEPFVLDEATVHFGKFPGPAAAWDEDPSDDEAMVLIPVRGDPSITYVELSGGLSGDDLHLECGQASDEDGGRYCGDAHRLRFLRNDPDADRISREPFRIQVSTDPEPLAFVTHQGDADLSLLALEGLQVGGDGRPAIVHQTNMFSETGTYAGGFGIAQRPCDPETNAPASTLECTRPLLYASLRWQDPLAIQVFTAVDFEPLPESEQVCVGPDELDTPGGIICEPQSVPLLRFGAGGLSTLQVSSAALARLADVAFSASGDELYVLQVNPGALIRVDTSLGEDQNPINYPVSTVEVCARPTTLRIYDDGINDYALVSCYRSAELFIVDLSNLSVAGLTRAGIGPDQLEIDYAREAVYVANSLDATVSVIDMARDSATRFTEIGRIGLSEPYVQ
ncbi:hypothetical protein G6O69_29130 [Pseudenhygromyxa sp. WMMC2535]|uniref:YncE family protein n=1 Tax=Pseudenhygromyxa sp. WMMC2535 TaxID=2712867 RepID=UPI0015536089|nr:hypothetical protein [Pseudenhygromyxa sp. WMMC2535]NVB41929.1 hypothetical protein [Pseudenhygromyxa sp. WMMC2535]